MGEVNFWGTWFTPLLGGLEGVDDLWKAWNGKNPWEWVKYDWNEPSEPQLVPFRDFVGVNIAPVSKKTAVKAKIKRILI